MREVIDDLIKRQTILQQFHNNNGHKRRENTYERIVD